MAAAPSGVKRGSSNSATICLERLSISGTLYQTALGVESKFCFLITATVN